MITKNQKETQTPENADKAFEQISSVRRSRPILCKNCKHYIGLNTNQTKYLCWRKKMYVDPSGEQRKGEICEDVNKDFNCETYRVKWYKVISAFIADNMDYRKTRCQISHKMRKKLRDK